MANNMELLKTYFRQIRPESGRYIMHYFIAISKSMSILLTVLFQREFKQNSQLCSKHFNFQAFRFKFLV